MLPNGLVADTPAGEYLVEEAERAAVGVVGDEHVVARAAQRADQAVLGGHPGRERERLRAVLQGGEAFFEGIPRRVRGARVLVAAAGAAHAVLLVGRRLIDRRGHGAGVWIRFLAGAGLLQRGCRAADRLSLPDHRQRRRHVVPDRVLRIRTAGYQRVEQVAL